MKKSVLCFGFLALVLAGCDRGETTPSGAIGAYTNPYTNSYPTPTPYPGAGYTYYPDPTPFPSYTGGNTGGGYTTGGYTTGGYYSGTALTCMIGHLNVTYYAGSWVFESITTSTGETAVVTNWDAGEPWNTQPYFPRPFPLSVRYDAPGRKLMQVWARGAQSGLPCNNGQALTDYIMVY